MKRRRSKIARLPKEIRDGINGKLEEGVIYREICRWLGEQGYPGFSEVALSRWFKGGHADWLAEREQLEELKMEQEFAQELMKEGDWKSLQEASQRMVSAQFLRLATKMNTGSLQGVMESKPEVYVRLVNSLVRLGKGRLALEKQAREWGLRDEKTKLTPEEQQRRMKEVLGLI